MNNISYESLILSEYRLALIDPNKQELSDRNLVKAMTVNENLITLGYTLSPIDVINLARSSSVDNFYDFIKSITGDVKAAPMYPNFPNQVMEMDEAQFRYHQMLHYMSTYGLEMYSEEPVIKGWLPDTTCAVPKINDDDIMLKAKRISLIYPENKYILPLKKILQKSERMSSKEEMIVRYAVEHMEDVSNLGNITVKFKQNMFLLFYTVFSTNSLSPEDKLLALKSMCQHTGDVWKCVDYTLTRNKYHFRTSEKRLIVKLLESYPATDFNNNIILSNKKAARVGLILNYIDYNTYSRSPSHKEIVNSLRNGELRSWESVVTNLLTKHSKEAIPYMATKPGVLLRKLAHLVRLGYPVEDIKNAVVKVAEKLSTQTILSIINKFDVSESEQITPEKEKDDVDDIFAAEIQEKAKEEKAVYDICVAALQEKFKSFETAFKGKKIFIDDTGYSLEHSAVCCKDKSDEGGYIRNGLAIKIPDDVKRLRFFVYWNDKQRVDVDLHTNVMLTNDKYVNIGWNSDRLYKDLLAFSGDITHSDAAEYIDINMESSEIANVSANIHLYSGKPSFKDVDECFVGIMAVNKLGEDVKLYNPANCFFSHFLTSNTININYGYIDVQNRLLVFAGEGKDAFDWYSGASDISKGNHKFNLKLYLEMLASAQDATIVSNKEDADYVLVMEKPGSENELSILDENFFINEVTES